LGKKYALGWLGCQDRNGEYSVGDNGTILEVPEHCRLELIAESYIHTTIKSKGAGTTPEEVIEDDAKGATDDSLRCPT
jgi:hypothetical protein